MFDSLKAKSATAKHVFNYQNTHRGEEGELADIFDEVVEIMTWVSENNEPRNLLAEEFSGKFGIACTIGTDPREVLAADLID